MDTKIKLLVVGLGVLMLASFFAVAEPIDLEDPCVVDEDCGLCDETECYYCNQETGTCFYDDSNVTGQITTGNQAKTNTTNQTTGDGVSKKELEEVKEGVTALEATLEEKTSSIEEKTLSLEEQVSGLEASHAALEQKVTGLNTEVQNLKVQQNQDQQAVNTKINTISTGMASLQKDVKNTSSALTVVQKDLDKEESFTSVVKYTFFLLLLLGVAVAGMRYMNKQQKGSPSEGSEGRNVEQQIVEYITKHIKLGKKFEHIKANLLKAGWLAEDIEWAYKQTMKQNYQNYLQKQGGSSAGASVARREMRESMPTSGTGPANKKVVMMVGFSILLILGVFLLIKGVTTGQAIHFVTQDQLDSAVKGGLEKGIASNSFYPLLSTANLCVQVDDGEKTVSYQIIKTAKRHVIKSLDTPCDHKTTYDFAVKFTNWESFDYLSTRLTCDTAEKIHKNKGVYVLPSKFVLAGFTANTELSWRKFCPAIASCLTEDQMAEVGIAC